MFRVAKRVLAAGVLGFCTACLMAATLLLGQAIGAPDEGRAIQLEPDPIKEAVWEFFRILGRTGYTIRFGSIGTASDYLAAYKLLSRRYRAELSFASFRESFRGIAQIEVLRLIPLPGKGDRRWVFVELRTLEEVGPGGLSAAPVRSAFFYYAGLVAVVQEGGAWKIDWVEFRAEDFISPRGGHQPWRLDPREVAAAAAREELAGIGVEDPRRCPCSLKELGDGLLEAVFTAGRHRLTVLLVHLANGNWLALTLDSQPVLNGKALAPSR